jgi:hypothetical protein
MVDETVPIARVPLARSALRMLLMPMLAVLAGSGAIVGGIAMVLVAGSWAGAALGGIGLLAVLFSVTLAVRLLSLRLEVEVGGVRLRWMGGSRRYALARGPVTRVMLHGERAARLRSGLGFLGWVVGPARLRDGERIQAIRLAPSDTLILVPIEGGRLGIAPASESELVNALGTAARVQQRLEAVGPRRLVLNAGPDRIVRSAAAPRLAPPPDARPPSTAVPALDRSRFMTGIERVQLEERLAAERAAALAAAEAERQAAARALAERAAAEAPPSEGARVSTRLPRRRFGRAERPPRSRPNLGLRRPGWLSLPRSLAIELGVLSLPLVVAGVLWLAALLAGRVEGAAARPMLLALVLAGPGAVAGAAAARLWWPRLVPLVVASAVLSLVMVGWSLVVL